MHFIAVRPLSWLQHFRNFECHYYYNTQLAHFYWHTDIMSLTLFEKKIITNRFFFCIRVDFILCDFRMYHLKSVEIEPLMLK